MAETITQSDFDARLHAGELALTIVAMSNIGKSHWSEQLAGAGFKHISCDGLIQTELDDVLIGAGLSTDIDGMATWMGQPYEPQFKPAQATYLDLEKQTMRRTIKRIAVPSLAGNVVVDTTGSVVYMDAGIKEDLAVYSTVVYLAASPEMQAEMYTRYIEKPKPVVWGDAFDRGDDEPVDRALARCYPRLLAQRTKLYEQMAQVTIPAELSQALSTSAEFLDQVKQRLPAA